MVNKLVWILTSIQNVNQLEEKGKKKKKRADTIWLTHGWIIVMKQGRLEALQGCL